DDLEALDTPDERADSRSVTGGAKGQSQLTGDGGILSPSRDVTATSSQDPKRGACEEHETDGQRSQRRPIHERPSSRMLTCQPRLESARTSAEAHPGAVGRAPW